MKTTLKPSILLLAILAATTPFAAALPTSGRRITGTILKVQPSVREAKLRRDDKGTVVTFIWNDRTTFTANSNSANAAILRPGAYVTVTYHAPFFGKPFVSRVTLAMPSTTARASK